MTDVMRNNGLLHNFNWSTSQAASDAIKIRSTLYGTLYLPATCTATTLTFQASTALGGTYFTVYDPSDDTEVAMDVTTTRCYQIPATVMTNHFIKCLAEGPNSTGMPVNTVIPFATKQ